MSEEEKKQPEAAHDGEEVEGKPEDAESAEDLFDLLGGEGEQFKKKKEEKNKQPETKKQAVPKKAEPKTYAEGTELKYSGHTRELPREMSEKEILEWLSEDDFPELSPERAEIRHDKDKDRLVPVLKAHKKGAKSSGKKLEVLMEPPGRGSFPPVFRLLGTDGVYEVRKTPLGSFIARIGPGVEVREGFYPTLPKAPAPLLAKTVRIFKERSRQEAVVNIVYDRREASFHLVWVEQSGSAASVTYQPLHEHEDLIVYAEIHSHGRMGAFFSATDDAHELRSGIYGVVGRVEESRPEALFRYSCGGVFKEIAPPKALRSLRRGQCLRTGARAMSPAKPVRVADPDELDVILVGAGGTGGYCLQQMCRLLYGLKQLRMARCAQPPVFGERVPENVPEVLVIDGDRVESANLLRQFFVESDIHKNKALTLAERYSAAYGLSISAYPRYITSKGKLDELVPEGSVVIGCVDNAPTRRIMHDCLGGYENVIYIDSGNSGVPVPRTDGCLSRSERARMREGGCEGQVVCGVRKDYETLLPLPGEVFPDLIEEGEEVLPTEVPCGEVVVSNPQRHLTNLMAATVLMGYLTPLLSDGTILHRKSFFDVRHGYVRSEAAIDALDEVAL